MTKYVFVTGGVISSLGKGIASASMGTLLQARGLDVVLAKFDPYLNADAGTMNPYQHGEVFVTDDGAETDLDLGHYERFTGRPTARRQNVTAGQIYGAVVARERQGGYLGQTVQVIPHVTDEIQDRIRALAAPPEGGRAPDVVIVEIGGTVGDIESLPFLEAIREFRREAGRESVAYVHLTLVPYLPHAGEVKTKPTQHSVAALRQIGISPDLLVCRSDRPIEDAVRRKIALFGDVAEEAVISLPDAPTIYRVPLVLRDGGAVAALCRLLGLGGSEPDLGAWETMVERVERPVRRTRIAIVGKYTALKDAYKSIGEALVHAGAAEDCGVEIDWIDSDSVRGRAAEALAGAKALVVPGGFGERGIEGMIDAIRHARETGLPFLGLCLGLQCTVIEFARAAGLAGAHSTEFEPGTPHPVVDVMQAQRGAVLEGGAKGGTMRLGAYPCRVRAGTLARRLYVAEEVRERHRHRYEVNNAYRDRLAAPSEMPGLVFSGLSPDGLLVETVEWPAHPYFIATQAHPEFLSRPLAPHPLFLGLVRAALGRPA